jgi:superfamily I DNA/RNA helicase
LHGAKVFKLDCSFRFGAEIARIANRVLFVKEYSPQLQSFIPYHVRGVAPGAGSVLQHDAEVSPPYTFIASKNATIFNEIVELLATRPEPPLKLHVLGSKTTGVRELVIKVGQMLDLLQNGEHSELGRDHGVDSFNDFCDMIDTQSLGDFEASLSVIAQRMIGSDDSDDLFGDKEMVLVNQLRKDLDQVKKVLESDNAKDADVILTTVHQAKGSEYHTVVLAGDFASVCRMQPRSTKRGALTSATTATGVVLAGSNDGAVEFAQAMNGEDVNLLFVAVTRAQGVLRLNKDLCAFGDLLTAAGYADSDVDDGGGGGNDGAVTDLYALLNVERTASVGTIHTAYRKMALTFYPDKDPTEGAKERFIVRQEAYETLKDRRTRKVYDQQLAREQAANGNESADEIAKRLRKQRLVERALLRKLFDKELESSRGAAPAD